VLGELAKSRLGDAKMTLLDLLVTGRRFKASEPRDKVYAFLGIYEDVRGEKSPIPIDYALPVSEVFKKTTIHILQEAGDLNILAHAGPHGTKSQYLHGYPTFQFLETTISPFARMYLSTARPLSHPFR
jgi:hypothetical protein